MIGELTPFPGSFTFHKALAGLISGSGPSTAPVPLGPRNRGQSAAEAAESANVSARVSEDRKSVRIIGSVLAGGRNYGREGSGDYRKPARGCNGLAALLL